MEENKTKYETMPFVEDDAAFIEEKIDAVTDSIVPPEEGAEDENLFFRITDGEGKIIGRFMKSTASPCAA